jgi:hypothetical protein
MVVTPLGIISFPSKAVQPWNAQLPIEVTLSPIETETILVQFLNALSAMEITL